MPSIFFIGLGLSKNKANFFEDKQKILKYKVTKTNPNPQLQVSSIRQQIRAGIGSWRRARAKNSCFQPSELAQLWTPDLYDNTHTEWSLGGHPAPGSTSTVSALRIYRTNWKVFDAGRTFTGKQMTAEIINFDRFLIYQDVVILCFCIIW